MGQEQSAHCGCFPLARPKNGEPDGSTGTVRGAEAGSSRKLLDKYELGEVLGQGAFGIVYLCKQKGSNTEYAVKMIDKVESPLADINREVEMLTKFSHPTCVGLIDVFHEKCFVCMVLEIYTGGDLIEGMQRHWESKGMIPPLQVKNIMSQTMQSLAHLHFHSVVHRDIKADNYLMDRKDILDPECKVVLNDFGTVIQMTAGQRLKSKCGTQLYWSPEFYRLDYGLKVDTWANGVVMYGIASGRFPFKGRKDVENKELSFKPNIPSKCVAFVKGLLTRQEDKRLSSAEALSHPWLSDVNAAEAKGPDDGDKIKVEGMQERKANAGVDERRRELVARLEKAQKRGTLTDTGQKALPNAHFQAVDKLTGRTVQFQWWPLSKVSEAGVSLGRTATAEKTATTGSRDVVAQMLQEHGIDTCSFGQGVARSLNEFAAEVQNGESRLMLDATDYKKLVRVVNIVLVRVTHGAGDAKHVLIHEAETMSDGRQRQDIHQLPGTKKAPHENTILATRKVVQDRLQMDDNMVQFSYDKLESFEESQESPHYPGVRTVYHKVIVTGVVVTTDPKILARIGIYGSKGYSNFSVTDGKKTTWTYTWLTEDKCQRLGVKMAPALGQNEEHSALVYAPIGYAEEELQQFLQENGIDTEQFGRGHARSLEEFSNELVKGEATLAKTSDGRITRIVDVVALWIVRPDGSGDILMETEEAFTDGVRTPLNRLPACKHRPDENEFLAAQRCVEQVLRCNENAICFDPDIVNVLEEKKMSHSYPGIDTVYRKRIIQGRAMT